ncbi:MAG: ABC transporter permease [Dehalococcoidia bacterium]|nr:ABC transporter permease [Dehalococcoidia bacterium]
MNAILVALLEIRAYLRDKGGLAFSLLLPIAIFALMYGAFGGQEQFHGTAYVVDEDQGGIYSARLIEQMDELDELDVELLSRSDADDRLEHSDLYLVLYIPQGFSDKLTTDEKLPLTFKQRSNGGQEGQIVASMVRGLAEEINQGLQVQNQVEDALAESGIGGEKVEITVQKFLDREREHPIVGIEEISVGSSPDPVNQFLPGIVTMFVLFSITLTARTLVEERKKGTLERLFTTRLSVGQLFAGKFLANVSRGFVQTLILFALAYAVFQKFTPLSFGSSLVIALVFAAAASALGLVIAAVVRTEDQATWIGVFFTMAMTMLGGTFFEISEGTMMETISRFSVNTYANEAFYTVIARGGTLADVGFEIAVVAGVAVVALIIARSLFKVAQEGK